MDNQCRVYQYLKENNVAYQSFSHPPALSAQRLAQIEGMSGQCHAKVVIVWVDHRMGMLVLDANHDIDFHKLELLLGAERVRLAREAEFSSIFPDCQLGALPPFGNLYGLEVVLDAGLAHRNVLCFPDGTHEGTIVMSMQDYKEFVHPRIVSFASQHHLAAA